MPELEGGASSAASCLPNARSSSERTSRAPSTLLPSAQMGDALAARAQHLLHDELVPLAARAALLLVHGLDAQALDSLGFPAGERAGGSGEGLRGRTGGVRKGG